MVRVADNLRFQNIVCVACVADFFNYTVACHLAQYRSRPTAGNAEKRGNFRRGHFFMPFQIRDDGFIMYSRTEKRPISHKPCAFGQKITALIRVLYLVRQPVCKRVFAEGEEICSKQFGNGWKLRAFSFKSIVESP